MGPRGARRAPRAARRSIVPAPESRLVPETAGRTRVASAKPVIASMPSPFDGLFFDFDGVILESAEAKTEALLELFTDLLPPEKLDALRRYHLENVGISRYVKFEWVYRELLGKELSPGEKEALGRRYSRAAYEKVRRVPLVPGARGALEVLGREHALFVVSGTPTEEVAALARERGVAHHFTEIWGSPATKPDIVRDLLARHALVPSRALFIGDGLTDYRAAEETGLHFLARDTSDQRAIWDRLAPPRVSDLRRLPELVASWRT